MSRPITTLYEMQILQKEHDAKLHQDIFHLSYPDRMCHLVFHYAKYCGRFADALDNKEELEKVLLGTYVDTFIITLSASDALNLNLDERMKETFGKSASGIMEYGAYIRQNPMSLLELRDWSLKSLAKPTGRMAKALESLDHMEEFSYRTTLNDGVVDIARMVLIGINHLDCHKSFDLVSETMKRWREIEKRRIL